MIWRGDIHDVDLGRPRGHEPGFHRPAVIVSSDILNNGVGGLVIVVPITSADYGLRSHIEIDGSGSGLDHRSWARTDQLRVVSTERILRRRGRISPGESDEIDRALRFILDL